MVTRRTVDRKFLLRPSEEVNQILRYLIALYAKRHGVSLHAFAVLSNHLHMLKTDEQADMPAFMRDLNAQTTHRINRTLSREGPLWDARRYSNVEVYGEAAAWDKLVYVMTNPVRHELVESPEDWPGLVSLIEDVRAGRVVVERPEVKCFKNSTLPKQVELELTAPPALKHLPHDVYVSQLEERVAARVAELVSGLEAQNRSFLGAKRAAEVEVDDRPQTPEVNNDFDPRLSCLEEDPAELEERIEELREWRNAYYWARQQWPKNPQVVFPYGTYAMRVLHNARVAPRMNL